MEGIETPLNPAESLQVISEAIRRTKDNIRTHSFPFLLWGWLISIASILFFLLRNYTTFRFFFLPFPVLTLVGIVLTINYYKRKLASVQTYLGFYLKELWLVLGISFILVVIINLMEGNPPFTYTLLIGGIGTLITGLVLKFRPLIFGGILFLFCSLASVFVTDSYTPLLQGIAVIAGYLIPGYLLKNSKTYPESDV